MTGQSSGAKKANMVRWVPCGIIFLSSLSRYVLPVSVFVLGGQGLLAGLIGVGIYLLLDSLAKPYCGNGLPPRELKGIEGFVPLKTWMVPYSDEVVPAKLVQGVMGVSSDESKKELAKSSAEHNGVLTFFDVANAGLLDVHLRHGQTLYQRARAKK